jgi:hypothetical protein
LTDLERLELADRKAATEDALAAHQSRMAEVRREMVKQGEAIAHRIANMGTALRERQERRVVVCYERWASGQIEVVRRDIDPRDPASIVDRRPASLEESQRAIAELSGVPPVRRRPPRTPSRGTTRQGVGPSRSRSASSPRRCLRRCCRGRL